MNFSCDGQKNPQKKRKEGPKSAKESPKTQTAYSLYFLFALAALVWGLGLQPKVSYHALKDKGAHGAGAGPSL